ncbi:hypothetical protein Vadar_004331 [Vaccinium darrowii]|uniref:Uncharacterized protein n=1 Tax=Vaccinium darrowii TaxID=229202 RepID=A0ACB7X7P5_9ERIC|nr:hypothetical protein Vadar_004331 [Vaccinium darrowii]
MPPLFFRIIVAADGIWDALSSDKATQSCRTSKTCCKAGCEGSCKKKQNLLTALIFGKKNQNSGEGTKLPAVVTAEELFEEGFAMLAKRIASSELDIHNPS